MQEPTKAPPCVLEAISRLSTAVTSSLGVTPDLTDETLPLVDGYLAKVREVEAKDERLAKMADAGAHFGEVVRLSMGARWTIDEPEDPSSWRVEFEQAFLYFYPIGMAAECLYGCEVEDFDGRFATHPEVLPAMEEMLSQATPLSEAAYFTLSGRYDALAQVADWLVARTAQAAVEPVHFGPEAYRKLLA